MGRGRCRHPSAFSLVELVMVIAIIAVLGAIAVPRMTKASQRAAANALQANLTNVRKGIDQYYAEHLRFPGYNHANGSPANKAFVNQLTKYTNAAGAPSAGRTTTHIYGPYLRLPFPTNPINRLNTVHVRAKSTDSVPQGTTGWHACLEDGAFGLNAATAEVLKWKLSRAVDVGEVVNLGD